MGDVIHALPAVTDISQSFPTSTVDWVVEENFREIPSWHRAINKIIPVAWRRWQRNWQTVWRNKEISDFLHQLRANKYDYIIDAQGLLKSAIITNLAHGKKYGYSFNSIREPLASILYQRRLRVSKQQHAITRIRQLCAQTLGYQIPNDSEINYGIKNQFTKIIAPPPSITQSSINDNPYVLFVHGSSRNEKCWVEEKWIELGKLANNNNIHVLLPWGNPLEQQRAKQIATQLTNATVLPQLTLTDLAKIMVSSVGVIGVDTGLSHLAAALEIPTISLYGPTSTNLIGTWGKKTIHINNFSHTSAAEVWHNFMK